MTMEQAQRITSEGLGMHCDECGDAEAVYECDACDTYMCGDCYFKHVCDSEE